MGTFKITSTGLGHLSNLIDGLKVADNAASQIPSVNGSTISIGDNAVSGADEGIPPVREDVSVDVPVREPAEVGSTGGTGGGSGHPGTGGGGHGGGSGGLDGSTGSPEGPGAGGFGDDAIDGPRTDGDGSGNDGLEGSGDGPGNDGPADSSDGASTPAHDQPVTDTAWAQEKTAAAEASGLKVHVLDSGSKGDWNTVLNNPAPNSTYIVDGKFTFTTNADGVVVEASARLDQVFAGPEIKEWRNEYNQSIAGGPERIQGVDHGGHIWGAQFGGPGERLNLFAQLGSDNVGNYLKMENEWAQLVREGSVIDATVRFQVEPGTVRPTGYKMEYSVDGGDWIKRTFRNEWSPS